MSRSHRHALVAAALVASAARVPGAQAQGIGRLAPAVQTGVRPTDEERRALSGRALDNLTAFTQALGYVRFFNPSAQVVTTNWNELAIRGVREVERAQSAEELASALQRVFAPVAPSASFAATSSALPAPRPAPANATHVVFWMHLGVGHPSGGPVPTTNRPNVYQSVRAIVPTSAIGKPIPFPAGAPVQGPLPLVPDPTHPMDVALAGGVSMRVPTALFTADAGVPDSMETPHPREPTEQLSASDRAVRLADVALAWSLLDHFYPYFDVVRTDWPGALRIALASAATDADRDAFRRTLERLVAALHDGHGSVLDSTAPPRAMPDAHLGWVEGEVVVTAPGDSGAAHGVQRGDVVLRIDGKPTTELLAERSALIVGATPQWIRFRALRSLLEGEPGSTVSVQLRGASGSVRTVRLVRSAPAQIDEPRPAKVADVAPGIVYVDLGRINDADFASALPRLQRATGIVFDMRGYPRSVNTALVLAYLADSTFHSAHFDIPVQTIPDEPEKAYVDGAWTVPPTRPRLTARVAFLAGSGAISYAESTLGIVESYHLGDIVGETTAGTNGNVNPFTLPGGYTVIWTGMRVVKRDGSPHHGVGIRPTVPVSPTIDGIRAGRDEVLERAIAIVQQPR